MNPTERHKALRTLSLMLYAVILAWALSGCAFAPPYPEYVLEKADPYITSISYLPDAELQRACGGPERMLGCYSFLTGEMFILDDPAVSDCVLRHERSHAYEVHVAKMSIDDTRTHKHWAKPYCYKPLGLRGSIGLMATP